MKYFNSYKKKNVMKVFCAIAISICFSVNGFAQKPDPDKILLQVKNYYSTIKDYSVDVEVKVDIKGIKVPDMKAKIYYKFPDKVHIESKSFAIIPKYGITFSPVSLLNGKFTALFEKTDTLANREVYLIKIIPLGNSNNIVLSSFYIDKSLNIIRRVETTTKTEGTFLLDLDYPDSIEYPLPKKMIFSFNLDKMDMVDIEESKQQQDENPRKRTTQLMGKVIINYFSYSVNKGIEDSVFEEAEKSGKRKRRK